MSSNAAFCDVKVSVRLRLSLLWAATMFLYVYNDFFSLYVPGALRSILDGAVNGFPPTSQALLFAFGICMAIPSLLVAAPAFFGAPAIRWANIAASLFYALFVGWTLTMPGVWNFYRLLGGLELTLTLIIAWTAWSWPRDAETQMYAADESGSA